MILETSEFDWELPFLNKAEFRQPVLIKYSLKKKVY